MKHLGFFPCRNNSHYAFELYYDYDHDTYVLVSVVSPEFDKPVSITNREYYEIILRFTEITDDNAITLSSIIADSIVY